MRLTVAQPDGEDETRYEFQDKPMSDWEAHVATLGVCWRDGPATTDYANARTADELYYAAGEHLGLHAVAIMQPLRLPRRGSVVLNGMRRLAPSKWREYWRVTNDAFCAFALIDLCWVRSVFRDQERWPELSALLDQTFVMACVYRGRAIEMASEENELFRDQATTHLIDFQDHPERTHEQQIARLMKIDGVHNQNVRKAEFIKAAIVQPSWLEPWALIEHYDRIVATHR